MHRIWPVKCPCEKKSIPNELDQLNCHMMYLFISCQKKMRLAKLNYTCLASNSVLLHFLNSFACCQCQGTYSNAVYPTPCLPIRTLLYFGKVCPHHSTDRSIKLSGSHRTQPRQVRWGGLHAPVVTEWWPACLHKQSPRVHQRGN